MTKKWSSRKLVTFSVISVVLVLLVLEIIFRILFAIEYRGYNTSIYIQGNTLQMNDSILIFRNRPFYFNYHMQYQYNEEGMRSEPKDVFMPKKSPDDFWVFVFGGSAMEGTGSNKDGEWLDITGVTDYTPDETIPGMLQRMLQQKMPSKKVRVFNAANSGFTIWQSMMRYRQLSEKYTMDWVVSMDAENEPPVLRSGETVQSFIKERWEQSGISHFPLNTVIAITSHSAFVNKLKQWLFQYRLSHRLKRNEKNNYPARKSWSGKPLGQLKFANTNDEMERAINTYFNSLRAFDSLLTANQQAHTLYIQPHLAFRDTTRMNTTERALYNYYTASYNDPFNNSFKRRIYQGQDSLPKQVHFLSSLHARTQQVFVDYCHFTLETNEYIAGIIAEDILRGSKFH